MNLSLDLGGKAVNMATRQVLDLYGINGTCGFSAEGIPWISDEMKWWPAVGGEIW